MSKHYKLNTLSNWGSYKEFGKARGNQDYGKIEANFEKEVLYYLNEKVINHLLDSIEFDKLNFESYKNGFNDFSFLTAPAYKALEGFLFQLSVDLKLPSSGNDKLAGSYFFDEGKIDKHIDKLLKELTEKADIDKKLSPYEKRDIKDRIKEMKGFLQHYRHTPAHFNGQPIDTLEKAHRNIMVIYSAIDNTAMILLNAGLMQTNDEVH